MQTKGDTTDYIVFCLETANPALIAMALSVLTDLMLDAQIAGESPRLSMRGWRSGEDERVVRRTRGLGILDVTAPEIIKIQDPAE